MGGLGNQMFQYALGRNLSLMHNTELKLDLSSFCGWQYPSIRHYELNCFNIEENFCENDELKKLKGSVFILNNPLTFFLSKVLFSSQNSTYFREKTYEFNDSIFSSGTDLYLEGYWQSEKYFASIRDVLLSDFSYKESNILRSSVLLDEIKNSEAIAVHIRRGDYTKKRLQKIYHLCSLDYYTDAVNFISDKISNPHVFVFSDNPQWAMENLKLNCKTTFIEHEQKAKGWIDMQLMRMCKHFVIANSSFGWWGAWLATNPNKIVVAPQHWFKSEKLNTKDLIPSSWIKM